MAKGFLDRLATTKVGGLFVATDEGVQPEDSSSEPASSIGQPVISTRMVTQPVITQSSFGTVDPEIRAKIEKIAKAADQVSFTKFSELLAGMRAAFPGDEAQAYRASLVASKTSGYPTEEIIRGLDVILAELGKFEKQFQSAVPARISAKVGSRQQRISDLQQTLENRRQTIASIQAELARLQGEASQLESGIQTETAAIAVDEQIVREDEAKFSAAMQEVRSVYLTEKQKLQTYGGK